ncbi:MAG: iron-sulfur cluster-binding protein, partial [Candidatus Aenigmatarchaeota archaeon]
MSKVVIAEGKDIVKRTYLALKELKPKMPKKGERILIKPNLVEPMPNYSGAITRKEVIEGII